MAARRTTIILTSLVAAALGARAVAASDERTISFYHIHTKETLTVTYKRDGKFIPAAMKEIDHLMRDWRLNKEIEIDPNTIDIIWEMHRELGSKEPVHVICGHRSRGTNEMLRRTVGGQASNSQHITGKAIDIAFPDVPAKMLRYSAMIRERGGVGYYPTSAIPFVHVDTARVRHWPNMPRDELALLFPSGHTQHHPSDGGSITKSDVTRAKSRSPETARQVALFFEQREKPDAGVLVADARSKMPSPEPAVAAAAKPTGEPDLRVPAPEPATARTPDTKLALASPAEWKSETSSEPEPQLVAAPRLVERPTRFTRGPSEADRGRLTALVADAAEPPTPARPASSAGPPAPTATADAVPQLVKAPAPAVRPERPAVPAVVASLGAAPVLAKPSSGVTPVPVPQPVAYREPQSWAAATEFDDDHPEELVYRPFPLAPLLTASASADDPALAGLVVHPDMGKTFEMLDDEGRITPMRFRPGRQTAELMWSKEFRGQAVDLAEINAARAGQPTGVAAAVNNRLVKTSLR